MNLILGPFRPCRFNNLKWLSLALTTILLVTLITGCEDDPNKIGIEILPGQEKLIVYTSDTTTVLVHSVFADSIKTDETTRSMLGSYLDPVFGLNTVSIATQVRLSTSTLDFGENPVLDSVVLSFEYTTITTSIGNQLAAYGDTTTLQNIKVYELNEDLVFDTSYYSNYNVAVKPTELANININFRPTDSTMIDTVLVKPQLRMRLSDEFGESLLNAPDYATDSVNGFLAFMKGLYIKPEPVSAGGAIVFFDLLAIPSRLTLYFKDDDGEQTNYMFPISAQCARFMNFNHDYSLGDPDFQAQLSGDTLLGAERFYIQSLGGVEAKISFPYIKDWVKDQSIALNEAKLIFYNSDTANSLLPPTELFFFELNEDGSLDFIPDQFEGTRYFGGYYQKNSGEYFFRITQKIQKMLTGTDENTSFSMGVSGASLTPNRVLLHGYNPETIEQFNQRIKLKIIYTKIGN
ncbi:MAG: DUF4270 domain-containing protein [Bacteroidales bacterium]|nr:DUF4270 domain-containing protein [Bacteroidales bacterium]